MKRIIRHISTGVMILTMLAVVTGVFAERISPDAGFPTGQDADNSSLIASTGFDETKPEGTAGAELQSAPSATYLQEDMEEKVPLAGGAEPTVVVYADGDLRKLNIGDTLVLKAELNGFDGLKYDLQWQVRDGIHQWKNLDGEHSNVLRITITEENADWAYRAAVDTQPVQ